MALPFLPGFHNSRYDFCYKQAIDGAASNGHINILQWFDESEYPFNYTINAIYRACINNHINVLKWFHKSKHEFKYPDNMIFMAKYYGNTNTKVLEWLYKHNFV